MEPSQINRDISKLKESLGPLPEAVANPGFVVVSGLPGTGKTFFCKKLAEKQPFYIVESDALRKVLFPSPDYSPVESVRLFTAIHGLIEWLLENGVPVILDATNLSENNREYLYRISDRAGARLALVSVEAPPAVAYQRLQARKNGAMPDAKSDADWEVYSQMKPKAEKIRRNHFVVDTSREITPVIDKITHALNR
ncbi:MAG: AAA family ATPase [Dehalococcoidia bacterium]|nr:AAA family ATPase [Dehalococcoidia bacterium]